MIVVSKTIEYILEILYFTFMMVKNVLGNEIIEYNNHWIYPNTILIDIEWWKFLTIRKIYYILILSVIFISTCDTYIISNQLSNFKLLMILKNFSNKNDLKK